MNLYKRCTTKLYYFLVNNINLASGNYLHFRNNLLKRIEKLIMTTDDKIRDEKLQYSISRDAEKILTLSSGKMINMNMLQVKKYYLLIKVE